MDGTEMVEKHISGMEKTIALEKLRKRVKELKEDAAKEHSEDEIKQKITDVFDGFSWKDESRNETILSISLRFLLKLMKWMLLILMFLMLFVVCFYLATQHNPYLSNKIRKAMHDHNIAYTVARFMRIVSLPFHELFDLKRAQKWECLVQNPFYKSEKPNCELCETPLDIVSISALEKEAKEISSVGEPCVVIEEPEFKKYSYNYSFIRDFYHKNMQDLDFSSCELYGDGGSKNIKDFFAKTEAEVVNNKQTFGWNNCRIEGTRVLRKLFKRPSFVPLMSEIFLEKHLFIVHPESPNTLELPPCGTSNCFIAQVHGSSSVTLAPFPECKKNCTEIENVEIQTGDIFYYPQQPWRITVQALKGELSILYRSDFS